MNLVEPRFSALFLAWLTAALVVSPMGGLAQDAAPQQAAVQQDVPVAPPTPAEKARSILDAHCARCHQVGRTPGQPPHVFSNVTDMEDLVRAGKLVRPGLPDASRLYTTMLAGHAPDAVFDQANPGPTPDEIDAVRDWIEGLKQPEPATCSPRRMLTLADQGDVLAKLRHTGGETLKGLRFISLARAHNGCAVSDIEDAKRAVRDLVKAVQSSPGEVELPHADDSLPILAVRLSDLGWDASQWDALAALAAAPKLTDDVLRDAYATETPLIDAGALAAAATASGAFPRLGELDAKAWHALRDGAGIVDKPSAAADLGVPASTFAQLLSAVKGDLEGPAIALESGPVSQGAWRRLRAALAVPGQPGVLAYDAVSAAAGERLEVYIWPSAPAYKKDDLVTITAQANRDCHLTVINVDTRGEATVLFPSDSDPDNAIKAGSKVRIPSDIEPYRLRATEAGTESFIAVCALNRKRLLGVDQDFERQRFSVLGDWRTFVKTAATRETLVGRRDTPRQRRARTKAAAAETTVAAPPEQEARAAVYVKIE